MPTYKGFLTKPAYVVETSYASGGTPDTAIGGKVLSINPTLSNNFFREQGLGEGRNQTTTLWGPFDCGLSMEWEVGDFSFLQFFVGPQSGAGTAGDPYVLTEADNIGYGASDIASFALGVSANDGSGTDDYDLYKGCCINTVGLTGAVGDILKCSNDIVAKIVTSSQTGHDIAGSSLAPWVFFQGEFKWNSAVVGQVQSFALAAAQNLFIYRSLGDRTIEKPETGVRRYNWTLVLKMTDTVATTLRDHFYGQADEPYNSAAAPSPTEYGLELNFGSDSISGSRYGQVLLDDNAIDSMSKPVDLGGGIVEVTFTGFARTATGNTPFKWWTVA